MKGKMRILAGGVAAALAASAAGESGVVTRLDGTVYHGNDANRAVITNWQYQINRPLSRPKPDWVEDGGFSAIDLLLVYDKPAAKICDARGLTIREHAARAVANMNEFLTRTDMDTNFWFRLVGTMRLDVASNVSDALGKSKNSSASGWEFVGSMRDKVGADAVVSVVTSGGAGGVAYRNSPEAIMNGSAASQGFAVARNDAYYDYSGYAALSWVHELGHVMSCDHNPPATIVPGSTHRGYGVIVHDDANGCDYWTIMNGNYNTGTTEGGVRYGQTHSFSSRNHAFNGVPLTMSDWIDATQVMVDMAPHVAKWRPTKIPETAEIRSVPIDRAQIREGEGTAVEFFYDDGDAEIRYLYGGEDESAARVYDGKFDADLSKASGGVLEIRVFAVRGGEKVAGSERTVRYEVIGDGDFDCAAAIDCAADIKWALSVEDSDSPWEATNETVMAGTSALAAHRNAAEDGRLSRCVLAATVNLAEERVLEFYHQAFLVDDSFIVWLDDEIARDCAFAQAGGAWDTFNDWMRRTVAIPAGYHKIEFVYTQRSYGGGNWCLLDKVALTEPATSDTLVWVGNDGRGGGGTWSSSKGDQPWSDAAKTEGKYYFEAQKRVTFPAPDGVAASVKVDGLVMPRSLTFESSTGGGGYSFFGADASSMIFWNATEGVDICGSGYKNTTALSFSLPVSISAPFIKSGSGAGARLSFTAPFGRADCVTETFGRYFGSVLPAGSGAEVVIAPGGTNHVQVVDSCGGGAKNGSWSFEDSWLVVSNGTLSVNGALGSSNAGDGLFQHKRILVGEDGILDLPTTDSTGYNAHKDNIAANVLCVTNGGKVVVWNGDRLHRPLAFAGGSVEFAVPSDDSRHGFDFHSTRRITVTADSALRGVRRKYVAETAPQSFHTWEDADAAPLVGVEGADAAVLFSNGATLALDCDFDPDSEYGLSLTGTGALEIALRADSKPNIPLAALPADDIAITVTATNTLANGKYPLFRATGDGVDLESVAERVVCEPLYNRFTASVEDGTLYMNVVTSVGGYDSETDTEVPVPYSWMLAKFQQPLYYEYFMETIAPGSYPYWVLDVEAKAKDRAANAKYAVWEAYALGLDPTNPDADFTAAIRIEDGRPVVEFSPTNTALSIRYILQGKPSLGVDWEDRPSFDDPGSANRFFRVKAVW